ncbi:deoxyribose-phosphate aldolase [Propionicicella superfundia]|uniref:deoxyribose-phosphate aldolase n=1 Tax=Propionicicella superfundia TaxID=348582 RepID=UPI000418DE4F|nr:deoxyribose-phosphate aldolase [Propionicicella superfundia]
MTQSSLTRSDLATYFDHTLLRADATRAGFEKLCGEAREYGFAMVAVNPSPVRLCRELLAGTDVHVGAAIAFPLGQNTIAQKVAEATSAMDDGADEIDYVLNVGELKDGNLDLIEREMAAMVQACRERDVLSKVILETCYLTDDEKRSVVGIASAVRPDFVKTSTGFGTGGATAHDIELLSAVIAHGVRVKASGGVRTLDDALTYISLGATRLGSSASVSIVEEYSDER